MNFIKTNFLNLIIAVLLLVIFVQRCTNPGTAVNTPPKIVRDTVWIHHDSIVNTKPQIVQVIPVDHKHDSIARYYVPDTNYAKLVTQYKTLVEEFLAKNIVKDKLKIDSIGYVEVNDTLQKNTVVGRSYKYDLKYPIIKETITLQAKKRNQLYVGGFIQGFANQPVYEIGTGLTLKNKKDQIYGVTVGITKEGVVQYGLQSYFKIKL